MKCKEFQIFDWIQDHNGFQWQIICVGDDYVYATFEDNEGDPWEFDDKDDQPEPIPLTPEILEKNGFSPDTFLTAEWERKVYFKEYLVFEKSNLQSNCFSNIIRVLTVYSIIVQLFIR